MTIAIMQPYFLPYLGYYQLINAVDKFILFDDVNYINKGWINRNRILLGGQPHGFSIPLQKASQNKKISEILVSDDPKWKKKILNTISHAYKKAPLYEEVFPLINDIIHDGSTNLSDFLHNNIKRTMEFLEIKTELVPTSSSYSNSSLSGQTRILDICKQEQATQYLNAIGGKELYSSADFDKENIELRFITSGKIQYQQFKNEFVPNLSMLDVMMFNSKDEITVHLNNFDIQKN